MTLTRRVALTALLVALPLSLATVAVLEWVRAHERRATIERVMAGQLTSVVRDACEADPEWFLAGPRAPRPTLEERLQPDADVTLPRPSTDELPFEIFAYNSNLEPSSTAGPRLPARFRDAMRGSPPVTSLIDSYESEAGTGLQMAQLTGWRGPCAALLIRLQPASGVRLQRVLLWAGLFITFAAAAVAVMWPTVQRVRRVSLEASKASRSGYGAIVADPGKDEISALAVVFNEEAAEIHRRGAETQDRIEALRRFVGTVDEEVASPLVTAAEQVSRVAAAPLEQQASLPNASVAVHDAAMRLANLVAASRLRLTNDPLPRPVTDLTPVVLAVVARHEPLAQLRSVSLELHLPGVRVQVLAETSWLERLLGNVVDNAIRYNRAGGRVSIDLERVATDGFVLRITDTGRGVTEEEYQGLTAVRRFRGDESWNRRPNAPGLGLAVAREIADRSGLTLELHRPEAGGFQALLRPASQPSDTDA